MAVLRELFSKKSATMAVISKKIDDSEIRLSELIIKESAKRKADELMLFAFGIDIVPVQNLINGCGHGKLYKVN